MIHWFEVENFNSFKDVTRINFAVGNTVDDNSVAVSPSGARLSKLMALFGANAAGKTNLLRALSSLAQFSSESFDWSGDRLLPFKPHFFYPDKPARLAIQFEIAEDQDHPAAVYRYEVEADEKAVFRESLRIKTSQLFSRVFERCRTEGGYDVTGLGSRYKRSPEKASYIAWLSRHEVAEAKRISQYFRNYLSNDFGLVGRVPLIVGLWGAIDSYRSNPVLHSMMVSHLKKWDFGLSDVEYKSSRLADGKGAEREIWEAVVVHRSGKFEAKLPLTSESSGTAGLFSQLSLLIPVLQSGGVAIVDELEADLHPLMVETLIDLFLSEDSNPRNAQLIFSTHADWVMNLLNRWSTVLVEKDECVSTAWHLSQMTGVKSRDNHASRYRAGAYGAIPRRSDDFQG